MKISLKQHRTVTRADQVRMGQCFTHGSKLLMCVDNVPVQRTGKTVDADYMWRILAVDIESGRHIEVAITEPVELVNATVVEE